MNTLVSIHIPKTAGTTFRELLQGFFRERMCLHYYRVLDFNGNPIDKIPDDVVCIHGHFTAKAFLDHFESPLLVTWLRNPVERVISEFEQLTRSPDPQSALSQIIAQGGTLTDFAEHAYARNTLLRYLDGLDHSCFAFIGICENFDEELVRFGELTGIELPRGHRSNSNPRKQTDRYPISESERARIEELNRADFTLYQACCRMAVGRTRRGEEPRHFTGISSVIKRTTSRLSRNDSVEKGH